MLPLFLSLDRVVKLHASLIETYGGSPGLRDAGLLNSAIAVSQASFGGELLHRDLFEMAAAYLYHIVENHPFIDGNKRTGAAAALVVTGHFKTRHRRSVQNPPLFPGDSTSSWESFKFSIGVRCPSR